MTLPTYLSGERIQGRSDDSLDTVADFTEDFSETTPTTWTEDSSGGSYAAHLEPYKSSINRLWFDMDYTDVEKTSGTLDLANASLVGSNVSDTQWTFRFKINVENGTGSGTIWVGLSDNAGASDVAQRFIGCRIKDSSGFSCGADNGGAALTTTNATNGGSTSISDDTDYYITVERKTETLFTSTIRTGSHTGTVLGTGDDTTISSSHDDFRYWKVMNHNTSGSGNIRGYIYDLEIYDGTNTLSTAKDKSTITNVPLGTRYEETDTRKIFRMGKDLVSGANLKVYLKFDEASGNITNVAGDVTGNATLGTDGNLTQNGGTYAQSTPSALGNGLLYDGTDDGGVFSTGSNTTSQFNFMHNSSANFSLCVWLKFDATPSGVLIDDYDSADQYVGMRLSTTPAGHFNITVARGQGNNFVIYSDGNPELYIPTDNAWHFYCFRYDYGEGSDALIYSVDGATSGTYYTEMARGWYGSGFPMASASNSNAYQSMGFCSTQGTTRELDTIAAELSIWNRRLTQAEVAKIYNSGAGFQLDTGLPLWVEKGTA